MRESAGECLSAVRATTVNFKSRPGPRQASRVKADNPVDRDTATFKRLGRTGKLVSRHSRVFAFNDVAFARVFEHRLLMTGNRRACTCRRQACAWPRYEPAVNRRPLHRPGEFQSFRQRTGFPDPVSLSVFLELSSSL